MQLPGIQEESLSTTPTEVDTILDFSDESLSTSLFDLGKKIGERFARKNNKDKEIYQAEALFVLTVLCKLPAERFLQSNVGLESTAITTIDLLIRKVYRELYKYMYADRVVSASHMTVWRHEKAGKQVVVTSSLDTKHMDSMGKVSTIDCPQPGCTDIELFELFDEVARSTQEREYLQMTLQGAEPDEIAEHLRVCKRVVDSLRARIAKRLKKYKKKNNVETVAIRVSPDSSGQSKIVEGAD